MNEEQIDLLVKELQGNSVELRSFISENVDEDLTESEIDELVSDLESDGLSLRDFILHVLED